MERQTGPVLAASRAEAMRLAMRPKVPVIDGGPRVGTTTVVNPILRPSCETGEARLAACRRHAPTPWLPS